jgi:hypothetical protein
VIRTGAAGAALAFTLLVANTSAAPPPRFFGVVPQAPLTTADYSRMADAGVGTLRFELSWALANPVPGSYDWTASDAIVAGAGAVGVRTLPFLYETPDWVANLDSHLCEPASCIADAPRSPAALEAWRAFAAAAAGRYGPDGSFWTEHPELAPLPIRDWQIWNEQNSPTFFAPRPSPRVYAGMLGQAHDAIKAVDPGARIVLGGMFGTPRGGRGSAVSAWRYLARLYARGTAADFDGVAAHPYAPTLSGVFAQVNRLRAVIARAGDAATPLWITELGWASRGPASGLNRGPRGQARRLRGAFRRLVAERRELHLVNVDWYSWRDAPDADNSLCIWCPGSGLVDADIGAKPALAEFTAFTGGR